MSSSSPAAARQPSDLELLNDYLRPWVATGAVKPGGGTRVHEVDLYSAEPAALAKRLAPTVTQDGDTAWYFLSPLRTKSPRGVGTRKSRAVPSLPGAAEGGCWHSESKQKEVFDGFGQHVGFRTFFSFRRKDGAGKKYRVGWIMSEFHLGEDEEDDGFESRVLCKMYRSPRHRDPEADRVVVVVPCKVSRRRGREAAPEANDEDDSESSGTTISAEAASSGSTTATTPGAKKKAAATAGHDNDSSAPRPWRKKHLSVQLPARKKLKVAADDEDSSATPPSSKNVRAEGDQGSSPASARKGKTVGDEDMSATPPTCKNVRAEDDQSSGPPSARKGKAASAPTAVEVHCPQCGFHLGALKGVAPQAKSETETEIAQVVDAAAPQGDAEKDQPALHHFI